MACVLIKKRNLDPGGTHSKPHGKRKAEIRTLHLQAKEHRRRPANHQEQDSRKETDPPSQPAAGTNPADTGLGLLAPALGNDIFLPFNPHSL